MIIARQAYYKVERVMTADNLETVIHQRSLCLYPTRIVSAYREFLIEEIQFQAGRLNGLLQK